MFFILFACIVLKLNIKINYKGFLQMEILLLIIWRIIIYIYFCLLKNTKKHVLLKKQKVRMYNLSINNYHE